MDSCLIAVNLIEGALPGVNDVACKGHAAGLKETMDAGVEPAKQHQTDLASKARRRYNHGRVYLPRSQPLRYKQERLH